MKREEAKRLVEKTFKNPFSKDRYEGFIRNLLLGIEPPSTSVVAGAQLPKGFEDHIASISRLGKYKDPAGDILDVVAVKLKNPTSLDRARTRQRNLMAHYLMTRGKDAALVAFYSDDSPDWRYSFVKLAYETKISEGGKVKAKREFTPARRYSFLVGETEPNHTAQQQLVPLLERGKRLTISEIEAAFNIETVTNEFFERYKELYLRIKDELDLLLGKSKVIEKEFARCEIDTVSFSKKLLGQIVFLYFIQKKGWLGVPIDKNWGEGDKSFLFRLFQQENWENYYKDILEPLFYEGLALERADDYFRKLECKVPFLNGGLFEPLNGYRWKETPLRIANKVFDDVFAVFNLYNFTVREDEPLEKEVAVDPEMLGKVFENLLEIKDRKSKGAFYTPREVVHYMCQESLIDYLDKSINSSNPTVPRLEIETFVRLGDASLENDFAKETGRKSGEYGVPGTIQAHSEIVDQLLAGIRICDPAIGSGAFPVGIMAEIVRARSALTPFLKRKELRTPYDFKWQCIEENIYGVDIDASAVEIAKLRLWLSLVVDEESYGDIRPLPNLDYKVVCGNSLLTIERNLFNFALYPELEKKKIQYFSVTSQKHKDNLRREIQKLIGELTEGNKTFDFEVYFSEVFSEKKGFDIVIGNPPYLESRSPEFTDEMKDQLQADLKKRLGEKASLIPRGSDLLIYFLELGTRLINDTGTVTQITQNAWLNTEYGAKFQTFLLGKTQVEYIIDSDYKYFDTANVNTVIVIIGGKKPVHDPVKLIRYKVSYSDIGLSTLEISGASDTVNLKVVDPNSGLLRNFKWGVLLAADDNFLEILRKLESKALPINQIREAQLSIGQGLNVPNSFVFTISDLEKLGISQNAVIPFFSGRFTPRFQLLESPSFIVDKSRASKEELRKIKSAKKVAFDFMATRKRPPILVMPRGVGGKHYCALNKVNGFSDSGVEVYDEGGSAPEEIIRKLWVFYNSTLFWLIRELSGRKNLGGGMLKAEAVDIRNVPAYMDFPDFDRASDIFDAMSKRPVMDAVQEIEANDHKTIDDMVFGFLEVRKESREKIAALLVQQIDERYAKART